MLEGSLHQNIRHLSPGSGISYRYGCFSMVECPDRGGKYYETSRDDDSGLGSLDSQSQIIRHIDRNILSCQLCHHRYKEPKILPCLHTFCVGCLDIYLPSESLTIPCPLCGQLSILPQKGVKDLQGNHFIGHLIEVLQGEDPITTDSFTNSSYDSEDDSESEKFRNYEFDYGASRILYCAKHSGQSLRFYCQNCETAVCSSCTDIEHREHYTMRLSESVETEKAELQKLIDKAYEQVPHLKSGLSNINELSALLSEKTNIIENEITKVFNTLEKIIESRKLELIRLLSEKIRVKQDTLNRQKEEIESCLADLFTSCEFVEKTLTHGSETEVLLVKKQIGERLESYGQMEVPNKPFENPFIAFSFSKLLVSKLERDLLELGSIYSCSAVEVFASGDGLKNSFVNRFTLVTLTAKDWKGVLTGGPPVEEFLIEIHPLSFSQCRNSPIQLTTELTDLEDGSYELVYNLPLEGHYELSISMFGLPIQGSPFKIHAVDFIPANPSRSLSKSKSMCQRQSFSRRPSSLRSFQSLTSKLNPIEDDLILIVGARGRNKGEFTNPQGVTVSHSGDIIVTDSNNQCVQVFGDNKVVFRFGVRGRSPGQMQRPTGVAVLPNGSLAVADYENKCVNLYSANGKYLNKIGGGKLLGPKGLAVNSNGHLIVVDNKSSSIFVFATNGKLIQKFGSRGSEAHKLAGPHFVALNSLGHILISDFHNHSIKVFDAQGDFLFSFGSNGEGNGQFNAPTGIAVDEQDNILVADWGNSRIQVFNSHGSFLSFVNTLHCPLYGPQGLALTSDGIIVVADSGNHCYKLYKYLS